MTSGEWIYKKQLPFSFKKLSKQSAYESEPISKSAISFKIQVLRVRGYRCNIKYITISFSDSSWMVLFFQPDASQLTGFAVPIMIMLSRKTNSKVIRLLIISVYSLFIILSWMYLDNLPPVNYVERIVNMVADMGLIWLILGAASLVALPVPFLLFPPQNTESISRYIGCYYIIIILSTLFGNFPVPLMGYGISPIIGFYISLIWYINSKYAKSAV